jgi:transposase-like protein
VALGFWQAIEEVWPKTRGQRCWVHKTANVLNKLPKSQHLRAKRALQEIWMAETKKDALVAFDAFVETWGACREDVRGHDQTACSIASHAASASAKSSPTLSERASASTSCAHGEPRR